MCRTSTSSSMSSGNSANGDASFTIPDRGVVEHLPTGGTAHDDVLDSAHRGLIATSRSSVPDSPCRAASPGVVQIADPLDLATPRVHVGREPVLARSPRDPLAPGKTGVGLEPSVELRAERRDLPVAAHGRVRAGIACRVEVSGPVQGARPACPRRPWPEASPEPGRTGPVAPLRRSCRRRPGSTGRGSRPDPAAPQSVAARARHQAFRCGARFARRL